MRPARASPRMGIDCRFLVGGLEKWLVEKRPLTGLNARTLSDLRAVPAHRNQSVLLDTPQVRELVDKEGAVFVDARYPGEFASDRHRRTRSICRSGRRRPRNSRPGSRKLPKKPIVVPCYDRRSCFFGEVLGLEFDAAGYDYRGRYTRAVGVLHADRAAALHQGVAGGDQQEATSRRPPRRLPPCCRRSPASIGLILTIILLACLSRLMILPFAVKAERDQIRARAASAEMDDIKQRLKDDPVRKTRAIRAFYKRHGITPGRNLHRHAVPADHGGGAAGGAGSRDARATAACRGSRISPIAIPGSSCR